MLSSNEVKSVLKECEYKELNNNSFEKINYSTNKINSFVVYDEKTNQLLVDNLPIIDLKYHTEDTLRYTIRTHWFFLVVDH